MNHNLKSQNAPPLRIFFDALVLMSAHEDNKTYYEIKRRTYLQKMMSIFATVCGD